jgi:hypothetical protein
VAVVVVGGRSRGDGASARLKIYHAARRRSLEDEGRHMRKGRGDDTLIGSAEPIWVPLGLPFGLWVPVGLKVTRPGVPWILRSEASIITRIRVWA